MCFLPKQIVMTFIILTFDVHVALNMESMQVVLAVVIRVIYSIILKFLLAATSNFINYALIKRCIYIHMSHVAPTQQI